MMSNIPQIDEIDIKILRILQENSKITTRELAEKVNLSTTPVFERMKRLEADGYIKKYVAVLDADKLGRSFLVFCSVKLKRMSKDVAAEFTERIQQIPEVTACYEVAGEFDYILLINAPSMNYYNDFIINVLGSMDSIGSTLSTFSMKEIKQSNAIYI